MIDRRRLWFSLLVPTAAFGIEGAFGWWIGDRICTSMPIGAVRLWVGAVTIATLVLTGWALWAGIGNYREATAAAEAYADRVQFMALGGVLVSASMLVGLIWFGFNAILVNVCGGMR